MTTTMKRTVVASALLLALAGAASADVPTREEIIEHLRLNTTISAEGMSLSVDDSGVVTVTGNVTSRSDIRGMKAEIESIEGVTEAVILVTD